MASTREAATLLTSTIVRAAGDDVETAARSAESTAPSWWDLAASCAGVATPVSEYLQHSVRRLLRERLEQPDPFASFPRFD